MYYIYPVFSLTSTRKFSEELSQTGNCFDGEMNSVSDTSYLQLELFKIKLNFCSYFVPFMAPPPT